jgi:hypothetical protein
LANLKTLWSKWLDLSWRNDVSRCLELEIQLKRKKKKRGMSNIDYNDSKTEKQQDPFDCKEYWKSDIC